MKVKAKNREKAREIKRISYLRSEQLKLSRIIAAEERRREEIAQRLQLEIRRLETLRRAH